MHNNLSQVTAYTAVHDLDNTNDSPVSLPIPPKPWYMSKGWRLALFFAFLGTSAVFFLNLSITIWALAAHPIIFGSGLLYQGSCSTTKQLNIGVHVIINAFSSVILSGSNYAMQCLSAPTRNEIDEAHAESNWMDIGVPSVRNLRRIGKARRFLWVSLALSSVPLHLFYNSVVFATLSANNYSGYVINEEWLTPNARLEEIMQEPNKADTRIYNDYHSGNLERLDPVDCIQAYSHAFVSSWGNLLVVTADNSSIPSEGPQLFDIFGGGDIHITGAMDAVNLDPVSWVCDPNASSYYNSDRPFCDVKPFLEDPSTWKLLGRKVEYCLSQRVEENCKLQLNATIAILVTVLNAVKAALLLYVCLSAKESPIMNIGDAVTSFLQRPDLETEGSCLLSREDITETKEDRKIFRGPRPFQATHKRWFTAAGRRRRHTVYFTISAGILLCCAFFLYGIFKMPGASPSDIWSLGFGEANEHTLMTFKGIRRRMIRTTGLLNSVLIANTGQLVLSFLYFACNGLLTSMLVSHEWSSYAHVRKGLRVSSQPQGHQRSTYFLQLPWRYSIPMIAIGTLLHWLGSQSIFLVTVEQWSNDRDTGTYVRDDFHDFATCGYSPLALLIFILAAVVSLLALIVIGFRKFRSGMPVVANCSLIIAAACHPEVRPEPENLTQLPLQWGVVGGVEDKDGESGWLWRCSFSSQEVEYPTEGTIYS